MDDARIVDLYWSRLQQAIAESKAKYGVYCRGIAYRILQCNEDADECENDTYLRAWNAMPPSRPRFLGAFLARIARNLSLDAYSKKNAAKRGSGEVPLILHELEECVSGSEFLLEAEADNRLLSKILDEFLGSLSKEARVFFVQRYWMSLSIKDISSKNHVSEGKVKMSLHRTRRALRKRLSQGGCEYEIAG